MVDHKDNLKNTQNPHQYQDNFHHHHHHHHRRRRRRRRRRCHTSLFSPSLPRLFPLHASRNQPNLTTPKIGNDESEFLAPRFRVSALEAAELLHQADGDVGYFG